MLVRRPVLILNRISLLIMVSDLRKPVRECWRSVQRKTAIRTSPAAARAFTDIDNDLSSVSWANVVKWILNWWYISQIACLMFFDTTYAFATYTDTTSVGWLLKSKTALTDNKDKFSDDKG